MDIEMVESTKKLQSPLNGHLKDIEYMHLFQNIFFYSLGIFWGIAGVEVKGPETNVNVLQKEWCYMRVFFCVFFNLAMVLRTYW